MMALPVVTLALLLGYVKVLAGILLPSAGVIIAGPLQWAADMVSSLVEHAATWPASTIELSQSPTVVWTAMVLASVAAWLSGAFINRRWAMAGVIAVCILGFMIKPASPSTPPMRINMFAVGNGSCYLVRLHDAAKDESFTIMFDCGSQQYLDIGPASIAPALKVLGVKRIDLMIISHADLDHFSGSLDVMDHVRVSRVMMTRQQLADASQRQCSASGFLVQSLRSRGMAIESVSRGWTMQVAGASLKVHWPPADFKAKRANDMSLVLSIRAAERRLLLSGDIQQRSIEQLLTVEKDLNADICDLPHHGSFVEASTTWLKRVAPAVVLQSSGSRRLRLDHWAPLLADRRATRLMTEHEGMVEVDVNDNGEMIWRQFRHRDGGTARKNP
jgi:competence protein ComEC